MSEKEIPMAISERLPDIFSSKSNNNQTTTKQSIAQRNQVIDDYLKSLEQKRNKKNELSNSSSEDDKDPFSSKAMKNLKLIKKTKKKLTLPSFKKREKLKSEISLRNNTSLPKNKTLGENTPKKNKKMAKNKNLSDNNIMNKNNNAKKINIGKVTNINTKNDKLNSKWTNSSSSYNDYVNFSKNTNCNLYKPKNKNNFKLSNINQSSKENVLIQFQERSKSHIKQSYNLYKDKINSLFSNKVINNQNKFINNIKRKYADTQAGFIPYNNAGINNYNLYNNTNKIERNKKRNFTAKIIKNKITIKENIKQNNKKVNNYRINSTINNKHKIYEKLIQEKNNPYGLNWINKILKKNTLEKVGLSKEFINGVPVIKLIGKGSLSKREIKKKLSEIERRKKMEENKYNYLINAEPKLNEGDLEEEYNIPNELLQQFNKNTKNFFKIRKDIIEQPDEEDQIIE